MRKILRPYVFILGALALAFALTRLVTSSEAVELDLGGSESAIELIDTGEEFIITAGPAHLTVPMVMEGHTHDPVFLPIDSVTVPADVHLYGLDYMVVDSQGNELPREILHHFNLIDSNHRELFLPIARRLYAAGTETGEQSLPWLLFGHPLEEGQRIVVSVMLHNPTGVEHDGVHLLIRLRYVKAGRPWPLFAVYPFQFDVLFPAGDKSFDLPPGRSSKSYEASPAIEGRLMVVGSHLHPLATSVVFEDVTAAEVIWEGFPVEQDGELTGVTIGHLYRTGGVKIYPDHTYRATVYYDNPTGETITEGGMGVVAGAFVPALGEEWPEVDREDPLYQLDRSHFLREVRGALDVITRRADAEAEAEAGHHAH